MKFDRKSLRLYAVTDRSWLGGAALEDRVEEALRGGATFLQLREKHLSGEALLAEACKLKALASRYGAPFVVNDDVRAALACGADGVHVGQEDMAARDVRALLGPGRILGVSAHTVEEALAAERAGADYLGVGAMFATSTKPEAAPLPLSTLREICAAVSIPVVAIGGITAENLPALRGTGIEGVAVVSALFARPDVEAAARELRALAEGLVKA